VRGGRREAPEKIRKTDAEEVPTRKSIKTFKFSKLSEVVMRVDISEM
jgi:hypothetical protein